MLAQVAGRVMEAVTPNPAMERTSSKWARARFSRPLIANVRENEMITREKLAVFEKYGGDIDGLALGGTEHDKETISDDEWYQIELLVQKLTVVLKGMAARDYARQIREELSASAADEGVIKRMEEIANQRVQLSR